MAQNSVVLDEFVLLDAADDDEEDEDFDNVLLLGSESIEYETDEGVFAPELADDFEKELLISL